MNGIRISECNGDPGTCSVRAAVTETVTFCDVVGDQDPALTASADTLRGFGQLCVQGVCPGRNLDTTREVLRAIIAHRTEEQP